MRGCINLSVANGKNRVINVEVIDANEGPVVPSHGVIVIVVDVVVVDDDVHLVFHCGRLCQNEKK